MKSVLLIAFLLSVTTGFTQTADLAEADKNYSEKNYDQALTVYLANEDKLSAAQLYNTAGIYNVKRDYSEAFKWYKKAADKDHPGAMNRLGDLYFAGNGVSKDLSDAVKWYKKAANLDNANAMSNLGFMYYQGNGVKKDFKEALSWWEKAVAKGHGEAMYGMHLLYSKNDQGVNASLEESMSWLNKSANSGASVGMYTLGLYKARGIGGEKDYVEAIKWLTKAADKNNHRAIYELARLHHYGDGFPQNSKEALRLYKKAAEMNNQDALKVVADLEKALNTPLPEMVRVEGGTFKLGATDEISIEYNGPPVNVTLSGYSIGKYEITVAQYKAFCSATGRSMPSKPYTDYEWIDDQPIVMVKWIDAVDYCKWLSSITGKTFRLPTDAEWEYAAKGGKNSRGYKYSGSNDWNEVSWNYDNSGNKIHAVGTRKANELGIYDMSGNASEWTSNWSDKHPVSPVKDPKGPSSPLVDRNFKIVRGGSWQGVKAFTGNYDTKVDSRRSGAADPDDFYDWNNTKDYTIGFRIVRAD